MGEFSVFDERRQQMAAQGFEVAQIIVDKVSHQITSVAYTYVGTENQEPVTERAKNKRLS